MVIGNANKTVFTGGRIQQIVLAGDAWGSIVTRDHERE